MKRLLLIRHAKSDWNDLSLSDFDRPLNDRGKNDAPVMANRLRDKKIDIDAIVSSPAKRAKKTASVFAKELKMSKDDIIYKESLYGAGADEFFNVIAEMSNKLDTVAIVSHNPGLTDFANQLSTTRIDNIPTSAIFAIKIDCKKWSEFRDSKKEFWFFDSPKGEKLE